VKRGRLAAAALAAALVACGVRAPPRPPEATRRAVVEPAPVGTTAAPGIPAATPSTPTSTQPAP
jgi:hypothetical protein